VAHERLLIRIRSLVRRGRYRLSIHAERERDADQILITHFEEALSSERLELLEATQTIRADTRTCCLDSPDKMNRFTRSAPFTKER
jgi:hypothetical protein